MAATERTSSGQFGAGASRGEEQVRKSLSKRRFSRSDSRAEEGRTPTPTPTPISIPTPTLTQQESQIELKTLERRDLLDSRKDMLSSINAYSVVLVLLASVTFAGFLQPPGGLKQDETEASGTLQRQGFYMNNFIVPLTISFFLAVAGILLCMSCIIFVLRLPQRRYQSQTDHDKKLSLQEDIIKLHVSLKWARVQEVMINVFFTLSLFCCTQAFVYAGFIITQEKQREYLRRVLYVFETINVTLFVTYTLFLILSCFFGTPLCYDLQLFVEWLIKRFKRVGISARTRLTNQTS